MTTLEFLKLLHNFGLVEAELILTTNSNNDFESVKNKAKKYEEELEKFCNYQLFLNYGLYHASLLKNEIELQHINLMYNMEGGLINDFIKKRNLKIFEIMKIKKDIEELEFVLIQDFMASKLHS